jgi:hypothetical protein
MTTLYNTLSKLFSRSIADLIVSFYCITNNDAVFKNYKNCIEKFVYAKVFCRTHNKEFSIDIVKEIDNNQYEYSSEFRHNYNYSLDTTHYKQMVYTPVINLDDTYPDPDDQYSPRDAMISKSYSIARTLSFSPFQTKFQFWCRACNEDLTVDYPKYTIADKIDNGRISTSCVKHR